MSSDRVWHMGPPPHVGWWNAGFNELPRAWRWWDGIRWSRVAWDDQSASQARALAYKPARTNANVRWTDYYPANARVPRINPEAS